METKTKKQDWKKALIGILFVVVAMGIWGYFELREKGATFIDNPTAQDITVQIDGKTYQVPAGQYLPVEISLGEHRLTCKETGIENEAFEIEPVKQGVINPTKSKYVIYNVIYTQKNLSAQFKPYDVEGREIYSLLGAPEVTEALFIPDRSMGDGGNIDVKNPKFKSYNSINQDYTFLVKIFRLNDFFEFYDKNNK